MNKQMMTYAGGLFYMTEGLAPLRAVTGTRPYGMGRRSTSGQHSIARFNRHTGKPHEHKREIARYCRQNGLPLPVEKPKRRSRKAVAA